MNGLQLIFCSHGFENKEEHFLSRKRRSFDVILDLQGENRIIVKNGCRIEPGAL